MEVSSDSEAAVRRWPGPAGEPAAMWHELECGAYRADLPLWLELADRADREHGDGAVLELGAGTGRVALTLARRGHPVTAVELEPVLVQELRRRARAEGLEVQAVAADARELSLARTDFALAIVAMQTIQLFGGARGRARFFEGARAHLRPGAMLACAIVSELEPFCCPAGENRAAAERMWVEGRLLLSTPTAVRVGARTITIERERLVLARDGTPERPERHVVRLARLDASGLEAEGAAAGLQPLPRLAVPETTEHAGSEVVVFRV